MGMKFAFIGAHPSRHICSRNTGRDDRRAGFPASGSPYLRRLPIPSLSEQWPLAAFVPGHGGEDRAPIPTGLPSSPGSTPANQTHPPLTPNIP